MKLQWGTSGLKIIVSDLGVYITAFAKFMQLCTIYLGFGKCWTIAALKVARKYYINPFLNQSKKLKLNFQLTALLW